MVSLYLLRTEDNHSMLARKCPTMVVHGWRELCVRAGAERTAGLSVAFTACLSCQRSHTPRTARWTLPTIPSRQLPPSVVTGPPSPPSPNSYCASSFRTALPPSHFLGRFKCRLSLFLFVCMISSCTDVHSVHINGLLAVTVSLRFIVSSAFIDVYRHLQSD